MITAAPAQMTTSDTVYLGGAFIDLESYTPDEIVTAYTELWLRREHAFETPEELIEILRCNRKRVMKSAIITSASSPFVKAEVAP